MAALRRRLRVLWRRLLRLERPRQAIVAWSGTGTALVLVACLLVALLSSWPWLVEPSVRVGEAARETVLAPRDASVWDSNAFEERRRRMLSRTQVQVVDETTSRRLQGDLEQRLLVAQEQLASPAARIDPLNLSAAERRWLESLAPAQRLAWEQAVRQAQLRMLRQGVVASVSESELVEAAELQLDQQPKVGRRLGARLVAASLEGRTNLRSDATLSETRIMQLLRQQGMPTIRVRQGDLIVKKGETITPQAFDVLDHFERVSRGPRPLAWLGHLGEALAACGVMLLVMRRWRASL